MSELKLITLDGLSTFLGSLETNITDNKQNKDGDAVANNIAKMNASGDAEDGGIAVNNIAQKDGYYSSLVAGSAENLVGHGSSPAEYTFRTAGGTDDLGSGTALIKKMKGKSIVFNQLVNPASHFASASFDQGTLTNNGDGTWTIVVDSELTANYSIQGMLVAMGHKYAVICEGGGGDKVTFRVNGTENIERNAIFTATNTPINLRLATGLAAGSYSISINVFDLTLMFGAGNEPSSADEFKALFPLPYYAYNAGVIKNNGATGIKTIGFNQWDEQWEVGIYSSSTGLPDDNYPSNIRSKNAIRVLPSTNYYARIFRTDAYKMKVLYYDANDNFIGVSELFNATVFTTPSNAAFIRFSTNSTYGSTYNNDICINLSWSGYRNGEYEAYWESLLNLNLKTITGIPAGGSTSETIFADGMRGVGSAYDELVVDADGYARKAIKRIGKYIITGNEVWTSWNNAYFADVNLNCVSSNASINCKASKLVSAAITPLYNGTKTGFGANGSNIYIDNGNYANIANFTGMEVIYALATPVEYTLDNPIYMGYRVDDFGTEQRLPADSASEVQAPIAYDVQYAMNAVDTIRNLDRNYVSINSNSGDDSTLKTLATALSTALGIDISWTWDETNREYAFTITDNRPLKIVSVPANASATGTAGNIAFDSSYLYICVATDTWMRVAIATW